MIRYLKAWNFTKKSVSESSWHGLSRLTQSVTALTAARREAKQNPAAGGIIVSFRGKFQAAREFVL